MIVARVGFVLGFMLLLAGCGPALPPAGNYATVSGRVTDAVSGAGVPGAIVNVNVVQSATSDGGGNFKIVNVPTGPWSFAVQPPSGYITPPGSDQNAPLSPGETRTLNIALTHS